MQKISKKLNKIKVVKNFSKNRKIFGKLHKNSKIIILSCVVVGLALLLGFMVKRYFVASVNGKLISRTDLNRELLKNDSGRTLDDLITKEIINQEAKKDGITVNGDDINSELSTISESLSSQGTTLEDALQIQGMTLDDLVENIKIQKIMEKILADKINVTDEEVKQRFEETKTSYPAGTTLESVAGSIHDQIFQEKISQAYQTWIQEKKVEYNIKYFSE